MRRHPLHRQSAAHHRRSRSGKTEVLTWRVAHLVQAELVAPEHLLVTTFTNKAALELKDRIQIKLPGVHVEAMQVSTLHPFCADLLRQYWSRSPSPRGFQILDLLKRLLDDPQLPWRRCHCD
jgi:superfamily I DNA/RNA helicase